MSQVKLNRPQQPCEDDVNYHFTDCVRLELNPVKKVPQQFSSFLTIPASTHLNPNFLLLSDILQLLFLHLQKLASSNYWMYLSMEYIVKQFSSHLHLPQQHLCIWGSLLWPVLSIQGGRRQKYWMFLAMQIPAVLTCNVGCPCPLTDVHRRRPPLVRQHRSGQGDGGADLSIWVDGQWAWRSSWTIPGILLLWPFWFSFCHTPCHICQTFGVEYQTLMLNHVKEQIQYFVRFWSALVRWFWYALVQCPSGMETILNHTSE